MEIEQIGRVLDHPEGSALALCRFRQAEIISVEYGFVHASAVLAGPFLWTPSTSGSQANRQITENQFDELMATAHVADPAREWKRIRSELSHV